MTPARTSARRRGTTRLMVVDGGAVHHTRLESLGDFLRRGDVLVVNTSATLPGSLRGRVVQSGALLEVRLAAYQGPESESSSTTPTGTIKHFGEQQRASLVPLDLRAWLAVTFGAGDWRSPTERRGLPPELSVGDVVEFNHHLCARVVWVDQQHFRLVRLSFLGEKVEELLFQTGQPIQYSYLDKVLDTWDQQTLFAGPPISAEPPSAAFPFTWQQLFELCKQGIELVSVLHGAGLSSTGDPTLDQRLPLPEFFSIAIDSAARLNRALDSGARIVALGSSALRAIASAVVDGRIVAGSGLTALRLGNGVVPGIPIGMLSGMHELGTSHWALQGALIDEGLLTQAYEEASQLGYVNHEYGDLSLITH